jgi:transcriptional regulator with XRE-family HTH domain
MKKETSRSLLGLTQQEMAILLKVTRSQWSHYERNSRLLPHDAGLRLQEMTRYMASPEAQASQKLPEAEYGESKTKPIVEKRLRENEYQLMIIEKKIAGVQQKFEKYANAVRLMEFLNSPEEVKKAAHPEAVPVITTAAIRNLSKSKSQLDLLQIDQKLLQFEQQLLKSTLETFS